MRTPDRTHAKTGLHARVREDVLDRARPLLRDCLHMFGSQGQATETLLLWMRTSYMESDGDELVSTMMHIAGVNLMSQDYRRRPKRRHLHVMVDQDALDFLDLLTTTYPGAFANKNEALERIIDYAASLHRESSAYFLQRLQDAQHLYPSRRNR